MSKLSFENNQPNVNAQEQKIKEERDQKEKELKNNLLRVYLTSEARQRLSNINLVKPDIAKNLENMLIQLVSSGKLDRRLNDDDLKKILNQIQGTPKREFKVRRI